MIIVYFCLFEFLITHAGETLCGTVLFVFFLRDAFLGKFAWKEITFPLLILDVIVTTLEAVYVTLVRTECSWHSGQHDSMLAVSCFSDPTPEYLNRWNI